MFVIDANSYKIARDVRAFDLIRFHVFNTVIYNRVADDLGQVRVRYTSSTPSSICRASLSKNANFLSSSSPVVRRMLAIFNLFLRVVDSRNKCFTNLYIK